MVFLPNEKCAIADGRIHGHHDKPVRYITKIQGQSQPHAFFHKDTFIEKGQIHIGGLFQLVRIRAKPVLQLVIDGAPSCQDEFFIHQVTG